MPGRTCQVISTLWGIPLSVLPGRCSVGCHDLSDTFRLRVKVASSGSGPSACSTPSTAVSRHCQCCMQGALTVCYCNLCCVCGIISRGWGMWGICQVMDWHLCIPYAWCYQLLSAGCRPTIACLLSSFARVISVMTPASEGQHTFTLWRHIASQQPTAYRPHCHPHERRPTSLGSGHTDDPCAGSCCHHE